MEGTLFHTIIENLQEIQRRVVVRTKRILLFVLLLALPFLMLTACKNEPAADPAEESILCHLTGVVYDSETEQPLEGALVSIGSSSANTDKSGTFVIRNVGPGTYPLSVMLEGYTSYVSLDAVVVDTGRFAPKDVEAEAAADIETIGDAKVFYQSVGSIALVPVTVPTGILTGSIYAQFNADGTVLPVSYTEISAIRLAIDEDGEPYLPDDLPIESYRATVEIDGSFLFSGLEDGIYVLAIDPFIIEYAGVTVDFDSMAFMDNIVVVNDGRGEAGNLYYQTDEEVDFGLKVVSIKAVKRSEFPEEASKGLGYDAYMQAGGGLCIEFNKPVDPDGDDTFFEFYVYSQNGQIVGYTDYVIVNEDTTGYAYVWHDGIEYILDGLKLAFHVSSFVPGDEIVELGLDVDYTYPLNIVGTNLYEYDYFGKLIDDYTFDRELSIQIVFDRPIPEGSYVEGKLFNGGEDDEVDIEFVYMDDVMVGLAKLRNGLRYYLRFKVITEDGVVIYNTYDGLDAAEAVSVVIVDNGDIAFRTKKDLNLMKANFPIDMDDAIELEFDEQLRDFYDFILSLREAGSETDIPCETSIGGINSHSLIIDPVLPLDPEKKYTLCLSVLIDVYGDESYLFDTGSEEFREYNADFQVVDLDDDGNIVFETLEPSFKALSGDFYVTNIDVNDVTEDFNPYTPFVIEYNRPVKKAVAVLTWVKDDLLFGEPIELICTVEGDIVTASLPDGQWLFPGFEYSLIVSATSEEDELDITISDILVEENPVFFEGNENGLASFDVVGEYDSVDTSIEIKWITEGYHFGEEGAGVYQLWKSTSPDEWELIASFDELYSEIIAYYFPEITKVVGHAIGDDDLLFGGYCEYLLVTFDSDGLMIQSPVRKISDTVAPVANVIELPILEDGKEYNPSYVFEIVLGSETEEYLDKGSVVIDGDIPEKMVLTPQVIFGQVGIKITFSGICVYETGDLDIQVSFSDTSGNESEPLELDF